MEHIPRLSEVLYVGLCRKIGTPTEVSFRRDVMDIEEMVGKPKDMLLRLLSIPYSYSGSFREGFRLDSSDLDVMLWDQNHKMISKVSQAKIYNASKHTIILVEDSDTPPGFVRLQLLTETRDCFIRQTRVSFNDKFYLSNLIWRKEMLQMSNEYFKNAKSHGPCITKSCAGTEIDEVYCLASIHWPKSALKWIERSLNYTWPPEFVIKEILNNGYHCVPIGSRPTCDDLCVDQELEWRLSFSRAEKRLVNTMNHTQFLCYGLLKIFLKEVINDCIEKPLLCSYHIKTTMFWIIQFGTIQWYPTNLLNSFWKCLKYLIHSVNRGVLSNFFNSQNNMFANKVIGEERIFLLEQLNRYYKMGVSCLLLSPTLRAIVEPALVNPSFESPFADGHVKSVPDIDLYYTKMLSVLSYYRLGNQSQCLQSLADLKILLHDSDRCVSVCLRDISWQILGICQQVVGDLHGALQSYQESLKQEPFHKNQKAAEARIRYIKNQLHRNIP
ncbi:uncharacterized protein LOC134254771 [Saccostrea cucullata]|uniref:uncharacterized protein LOC134254771 n=1 Tax=Saccostrea cuccullata TaxID=36930 RepID=UPI002ED3AC57